MCADEEELLCRSVWSERSGVRSTDRAVSQCRPREEMMSCSGHAPDGGHAPPAGQLSAVSCGSPYNTRVLRFWCSDRLRSSQVKDGQCVAYNRPGVKGVHAVARCCVVRRPQQGHVCAQQQQHAAEGCRAPPLLCRLLRNTSSDNDRVVVNIHPSIIIHGFTVMGLVMTLLSHRWSCPVHPAGP